MRLKFLKLALGLLTVLAFNLSGQNLYVGDTSAETQPDTLTCGNYSASLVPYSWDDTTAFDGGRSIRVDWDKKPRVMSTTPSPWGDKWISVENTPDLEIGETYTFSFYAKASDDHYFIRLIMMPSIWEFYVADCNEGIKLSREWKRHAFTFVAKMKPQATVKSYSAIFDFSNSPGGKVWYDAVQIEKGGTLTPYKNASPVNVGVRLNSPDWSHIYFPEDPVTATLRIAMPSGQAELQCRVVDYQGKPVEDFKQTVNGPTEIKLPLNNQRLGWFKVTAVVSADGKIMSSHSVNYIKIAKPVDIAPGIQPFSGLINGDGYDQFGNAKKIGVKRVERVVNWKNVGWLGTETAPGKFDWSSVEWHLNRGKEFGMLNKVIVNPFEVPDWYFDKEELAKAKQSNSCLVFGRDKHGDWRKFIGELIRRYGDLIDELELGAEDNGRLGRNEYYMALYPQEVKDNFLVGGKPFDDLCAMVKIGTAEIRKTHPKIKIGAIRPSRSSDPDDLVFVREMFKKIGKDFDILPVDFYFYPFYFGPLIEQRRGKSDGLIKIYNDAKKITRELGRNQPIYMSEFGWFPDSRFPDDSIYRQEQAETMPKDFIVARIAGYYAFDWFTGLMGESIGQYATPMQQNLKIQSIAAAYSAVARVVENVTESKWLTPDRVTRIAIMRKHDGQGVAAVWADKGYKLSLPAETPTIAERVCKALFNRQAEMKVTDLMGNPIQPDNGQFSLGQAPVYIWHTDFKQLSDLLAKAQVDVTEFCEIKFRMLTEHTGCLQFVNLSNATGLELDVVITVGGKEIRKVVKVPKGSDTICDIPLSGKNVKVKAKTGAGKSCMERNFDLDPLTAIGHGANAASLIASASARGDIIPADPWVPWEGPDDLSVSITSSWDETDLYIKVTVKDDKHFNKYPADPWNADSVQVAIDPKNAGAFYLPIGGKKLGPDVFEFGLALGDDGKSRCVNSSGRTICQKDNYTIRRDEKKKTTVYELRLAWNELGVKPLTGMVFGMSFIVFDDDVGTGQNYYIPIGGGIAGGKNSVLYKKFVLKSAAEARSNVR